ncbi:MFS transporter, ACS family, pantothenate transporter [Sporothrix brasiliensis 5110]|uniref:MFS transporter, ACS family, pantothenate transporter n=1 Tax=Sporothrix brasiliensis 5110 TaxID=1398154 RepID=A0A0C2FCK7_9PEZI|nr:MFS transporter, ACS family, pantothenate transporter [Sporothrix brasiliensis 5110]KIH88853.1 MFS transporter, ACS family, pantothenate transporter [Sporothrix brasiliensis 5110]
MAAITSSDTVVAADVAAHAAAAAATPTKRSFRSFIWDTDTHLKTPEERRLLRKLDSAILTVGCLGFFMKYLDQGNLANAYVSGLQEDLHMYGNQYTYATSVYTVAYAVMQIPSTLIIQRVPPRLWLTAMEVGWGIWTFAQAGMHTTGQLYAFRFLVGLFESSFFPAMLYLLGTWYTKTETAKRIALFHMTAPLGTAFGGYMQAAVYNNLDGVHGLAGWRWLYIVCGSMTVPVGIATFFLLPDTPFRTQAWYLTPAERELAIARVNREGKAAPAKINLAMFKRILSSWKWYLFTLGYLLYGESCGGNGYFGIWLKSEGFSVAKRNLIPTGTALISGTCVVLWGFLSDYTGSRFAFVLIPLILTLLPNGILAFWSSNIHFLEFAFLTVNIHLMTAVYYTWANEVCAADNEQRAVVISSMNGFQYAVAAWLPIVIFPQTTAPTFRRGFPTTFGLVIAAIFAVLAIQYMIVRDRKRAAAEAERRPSTDSEEGELSREQALVPGKDEKVQV